MFEAGNPKTKGRLRGGNCPIRGRGGRGDREQQPAEEFKRTEPAGERGGKKERQGAVPRGPFNQTAPKPPLRNTI